MANYDHIHDDNVVPLFEHILIGRRDTRPRSRRVDGLRARLRSVFGFALDLRKSRLMRTKGVSNVWGAHSVMLPRRLPSA